MCSTAMSRSAAVVVVYKNRKEALAVLSRKSADRIIVKSNERMELVLNWYFANFNWLDREEFLAPMESGVVVLQEEQIEFTFESKVSSVEIVVYTSILSSVLSGFSM